MGKYLIDGATLTNIANAIRQKNDSNDAYTTEQMAEAISNISSGIPYWEGTLTVNDSGDLVFPVLSFTPRTIVVSSVYQSYEFDDGGYAYSGFLCTAFYDDNEQCWFEIIPKGSSGSICLAENSHSSHNREVYKDSNNQYHFDLSGKDALWAEDDQSNTVGDLPFQCRVFG